MTLLAALLLASVRLAIADFISALIYVYTLLIFLYVVLNILLQLGLRIPYSRASSMLLGFLRDVCEPYLRLIRSFLPSIGGLDLSPLVAILLLALVNNVLVRSLLA